MKFKKEEKEETIIYAIRIKKSMREGLQKIADREKVSPALIIRKAIEMVFEQDRKNLEEEQ